MNKTNIEWCTRTWNPVTGCRHNCSFCFAERIARRFAGGGLTCTGSPVTSTGRSLPGDIHELDEAEYKRTAAGELLKAAFPLGFSPTLHRYRFDEPTKERRPQNVFVVDMGDLFGDWVPTSWILSVFEACAAAPRHNYLFLTKNPHRYVRLSEAEDLPRRDNYWFGSTLTHTGHGQGYFGNDARNTFLSLEPLLGPIDNIGIVRGEHLIDWVIVGAMTGPGSEEHQPRREWVASIVRQCRAAGVPVFMKNNLQEIMGGQLIQEMPWELKRVADRDKVEL